jgi:hypothetical protein
MEMLHAAVTLQAAVLLPDISPIDERHRSGRPDGRARICGTLTQQIARTEQPQLLLVHAHHLADALVHACSSKQFASCPGRAWRRVTVPQSPSHHSFALPAGKHVFNVMSRLAVAQVGVAFTYAWHVCCPGRPRCEGELQAARLLLAAPTTKERLRNGWQGAGGCVYAVAPLPVACCGVREVSLQDAGGRLTALACRPRGWKFTLVPGPRYGVLRVCALACVRTQSVLARIMHGTG